MQKIRLIGESTSISRPRPADAIAHRRMKPDGRAAAYSDNYVIPTRIRVHYSACHPMRIDISKRKVPNNRLS